MDNNFNNYNNGQTNGFGQTNNYGQTQNGFGPTQQNGFGQTNNFGQSQNGFGQTQQNGFGQTQGGAQRRYDPNSYATSSSQTTTNNYNANNQYAGMTPSDLRQQMHQNSFVNRASSFANNGTVGGLSGAAGDDNIVMGILGGLGGAVLGIIIWLIIARLGYMSWLGGFAISAGAFYGYLMLGKGFSKTGIIIVSLIIIVSVWFSVKMSWAQALSRAWKEAGVEYSTGECWKNMKDHIRLLDAYSTGLKISTQYTIDMVVGYLLTALGAFSVFKKFKG